jgi:hypothetical protein
MFGISYIKFDSMTHVIHFKNGKIAKEGRGLSFFYFVPNSSISAIPLGSNDLPFIFNEMTTDYQNISLQGQITYKIADPKQLAEMLDFTLNANGVYKKNDSEKLNQRIINEAQTAASAYIHSLGLKDAIRSAKNIEAKITEGLKESSAISILGIQILTVSILAVKATPEMARALETETREKLQQDADQAIYERRNFAVEQERRIKETELNTEIAVEEKKKQIDEKKMEAEIQKAENDRKLREMKSKPLGNPLPKWTSGIRNTFTYKTFTLSFLWDIRNGGKICGSVERLETNRNSCTHSKSEWGCKWNSVQSANTVDERVNNPNAPAPNNILNHVWWDM